MQSTTDPARIAARSIRPKADELAPYQATYVAKVPPTGDILTVLETQRVELLDLASTLSPERQTRRYAPGKWSVCELIGHIVDIERAFATRAMCFARQDPGPLPGVDEDPYVAAAHFDQRGLPSILEEFDHLRRANLALFASFDAEALERRGTASGVALSVRGIVYLTAGHAAHHLEVLRTRYLVD